MIVATLAIADGKPVVPGAALVVREDAGWYTAYFHPVGPGGHVSLLDIGGGQYVTKASKDKLALPGVAWDSYRRSSAIRDHRWWRVTATTTRKDDEGQDVEVQLTRVPVRLTSRVPAADASDAQPWVQDGYTITKAEPCLPSVCGAVEDSDVDSELPRRTRDGEVARGAR